MSRTLVSLALAAIAASAAPASADPLGAVDLTLNTPAQASCAGAFDPETGDRIGTRFGVFTVSGSATLVDMFGFPKQTVRIDVDGIDAAFTSTDDDGNYSVEVEGVLPGIHRVDATVSPETPLRTSATTQVEVVGVVSYGDADGDGWGNGGDADCTEELPAGRVLIEGDCDDTNAAVSPSAEEIYFNGIDDDCNQLTNDQFPPEG